MHAQSRFGSDRHRNQVARVTEQIVIGDRFRLGISARLLSVTCELERLREAVLDPLELRLRGIFEPVERPQRGRGDSKRSRIRLLRNQAVRLIESAGRVAMEQVRSIMQRLLESCRRLCLVVLNCASPGRKGGASAPSRKA